MSTNAAGSPSVPFQEILQIRKVLDLEGPFTLSPRRSARSARLRNMPDLGIARSTRALVSALLQGLSHKLTMDELKKNKLKRMDEHP
jgi:hypothetical protein